MDILIRTFGHDPGDARAAIATLESGGLDVIAVDPSIGVLAGELHARHYVRRTSELSMADCVALATALTLDEPLVTADPPLARASRSEGVTVIGLPDSRGRRPNETRGAGA